VKTRIRIAEDLSLGDETVLGAEVSHHFTTVLRGRVGDTVGLIDASGNLYRSVVKSLTPCVVEVLEALDSGGVNAERTVVMWVPLLKSKKTDGLIRQLTELGVAEIVIYLSERSVVRPKAEAVAKLLDRYERISEEATRQCRRTDSVRIGFSRSLPNEDAGVFLWEERGDSVDLLWSNEPTVRRLLIGPEGGLSKDEADALIARGWTAVCLGQRILRAETAVLAAASLAIYR